MIARCVIGFLVTTVVGASVAAGLLATGQTEVGVSFSVSEVRDLYTELFVFDTVPQARW